MKLENVDLSKLQLSDLPKFDKCPCELCDDGCFDRAGGEHYPGCQRKPIQRTKLPLALRCPLSHYKATFQPITNISGGPANHRRQPIPPPPDNEIPISFKNVPMSHTSSQRDDYPPPPPDSLKKPPINTSVKQVYLFITNLNKTNLVLVFLDRQYFIKTFSSNGNSESLSS